MLSGPRWCAPPDDGSLSETAVVAMAASGDIGTEGLPAGVRGGREERGTERRGGVGRTMRDILE